MIETSETRRVEGIQRHPEAGRRQGGDRLAQRPRRATREGNDMNQKTKRMPDELRQFLERYPDTQHARAAAARHARHPARQARGARRVRQALQARASISAARPCCSTPRARPSTASTTAAATAIPMRSRPRCPARSRPCPGRRCRPRRCCWRWRRRGRRAVLRRSAPGAAPRREAAAGDGTDRGRRDRARVLPARSRRRARRRRRSAASRARGASRTGRSTARWRTSRTSIRSSPSSTRSAPRRTYPPARRSRNSRPASSRSTCTMSRAPSSPATTRVLLKRAVKAVARRHGMARELHGEAVRGMRRLQPARPRQPRGRDRDATCSRATSRTGRSPTRCATRSAGSPRRCRSRWRSSRRPPIPIAVTVRASFVPLDAELGRQSPRRGAADSALGRRGHAHRAPARAARTAIHISSSRRSSRASTTASRTAATPDRWSSRARSSTRRSRCRCAGKRRSTRSTPGRSCRKYLGERYHKLYATCRREECDRFHAEITDRDYEWYLRAV